MNQAIEESSRRLDRLADIVIQSLVVCTQSAYLPPVAAKGTWPRTQRVGDQIQGPRVLLHNLAVQPRQIETVQDVILVHLGKVFLSRVSAYAKEDVSTILASLGALGDPRDNGVGMGVEAEENNTYIALGG